MTRKFLDKAYSTEPGSLYTDWAASYDAEVTANGYATPGRISAALAAFAPGKDLKILDMGCGTGISGAALAKSGFTNVHGCDVNNKMLEQARAKEGLYQDLWQATVEDPFPFDTGHYDAVTAMGVISEGLAPPETIDRVMEKLLPGGLFAFSLNDHALQNPQFEARVAESLDCGTAELLFKEYGEHLPGINMKSNVYVMRKR